MPSRSIWVPNSRFTIVDLVVYSKVWVWKNSKNSERGYIAMVLLGMGVGYLVGLSEGVVEDQLTLQTFESAEVGLLKLRWKDLYAQDVLALDNALLVEYNHLRVDVLDLPDKELLLRPRLRLRRLLTTGVRALLLLVAIALASLVLFGLLGVVDAGVLGSRLLGSRLLGRFLDVIRFPIDLLDSGLSFLLLF